MADRHRYFFCLFGCFRSLSVAPSILWCRLSWSFGTSRVHICILPELYSVWVQLIDNMKLLTGLHFHFIPFTHHRRVYWRGVKAQLQNKDGKMVNSNRCSKQHSELQAFSSSCLLKFTTTKLKVFFILNSHLFNLDITFVAFCFQFNWLRGDNICTG